MSVRRATERWIALERGQAAAGEDQRVREAPGALLALVGAVVDRDRLQEHQAVGRKQRRAALEERVEVLPPDRLDHLDRRQPVVAAGELPVVGAEDPDPLLEAGGTDPPLGVLALLARDGGRGHPAAVARGRVERRARPSLSRSRAGARSGPSSRASQIRSSSARWASSRVASAPLEQGARVHHPLAVEEQLEHLVAEVVVRGDVPASATPRVQHRQRRRAAGGGAAAGPGGRERDRLRPMSRAPIRTG